MFSLSYNKSRASWLIAFSAILPVFTVHSIWDALAVAPIIVLGVVALSVIPTRVIIVSPDDLMTALVELDVMIANDSSLQVVLFNPDKKVFEESTVEITITDTEGDL